MMHDENTLPVGQKACGPVRAGSHNPLISLRAGRSAGRCGLVYNPLISLRVGCGGVVPPYYVRGIGTLEGYPIPFIAKPITTPTRNAPVDIGSPDCATSLKTTLFPENLRSAS